MAAAALLILIPQLNLVGIARAAEVCENEGLRYNCSTESVQVHEIRPTYDNGLNGTVNASTAAPPYEEWPSSLRGMSIPDGVILAAMMEAPARAFASFNGTAQPNASAAPTPVSLNGGRLTGSNVTRALAFTVKLSPSLLMNGASEFYYRSPLLWEPDNYSAHYVEFHDEDGRLIASRTYPSDLNDSDVSGDRVYYRIGALLPTNENLSVTEYVATTGTPPIGLPHVDLYIAPSQDIDGNGARITRAFPGEIVERSLTEEPAYGFRFIYGLGPGGTMNLIRAANDTSGLLIRSTNISVNNVTAGANQIEIIVPLRMTVPISGFLQVAGPSASTTWATENFAFTNATGTLHAIVNVSGTINTSLSNHATLILSFTLGETAECPAGAWDGCGFLSYPMYPSDDPSGRQTVHTVRHSRAENTSINVMAFEWTPWIELRMLQIGGADESDRSTTDNSKLAGVSLILAGILVLGAAVAAVVAAVPLAIAGGILVVGTVTVAIGGAILNDPNVARDIIDAGLALAAIASCGGMYFAPGIGLRLAAGAACMLLGAAATGNLPKLLDFVLRIPEIIKLGVEKVGQWLSEFLDVWGPYILIFLQVTGFLFAIFIFLVAVKYALLVILGLFAPFVRRGRNAEGRVQWGYERPKQWPLYRKVYNWYFVLYSDLVERRIFKMDVRA